MIAQIALGTAAYADHKDDHTGGGPPPSANLDQCSNGPLATPNDCTGSAWQNGNLNATNSHYAEGQSAPYRVVMENLPTTGTLSLVIEYDIKHSGKHAIDYLTSFDRTETTANPCSGVSPCSLSGTAAFPAPSAAGSPAAGQPTTSFNALPSAGRQLSLYNATIAGSGITYVAQGDLNAASASTQVQIQFTASSSTVVFAWGGHIGSSADWGTGNSAGGISGSPYHMRLVSLTGANLGNQDRSLSADAVSAATPTTGTLTVIKTVVGSDADASAFTLNVTGGNASPSSFPGDSTGTAVTVDIGAEYSVSETEDAAYTTAYSEGCSGTMTAEGATCTVTNTLIAEEPATGTITILKTIVNDGGGQATIDDFSFYIYEAPGQVVDAQSGIEVEPGVATVLEPGTYWVSESGSAGYYQASFSGACDDSPFVTLAADQDLTCTITNTYVPTPPATGDVTVTKIVINDDGGEAEVSDFTLSVGQTVVVSGATNAFAEGFYVVSESGPTSGYTATFSGDCDENGNITVSAGEPVNCVITNDDIAPDVEEPSNGTLTVVKVVINDDGGTAVIADFPLFIGEMSVTSGASNSLEAGQYVVSETGSPDYVASFSGDCDANGVVNIEDGDEKTCTITNDDKEQGGGAPPASGTLIVVTKVINDDGGTAMPSSFLMTVGDGIATSSTFGGFDTPGFSMAYFPGAYVVNGSENAAYDKTLGSNCSGTMIAGLTVTCVVTYDDRPTGGSPTPPPEEPPAPPQPEPEVLGETDDAPVPVPQVLGATDSDLPVTGMPAWTLASVLLAAAPFLRRKRA